MGAPPLIHDEVRPLMTADPYYQFWSATQRNSQEMMWDSVIDTVERHQPVLTQKAAEPGPLGPWTSFQSSRRPPITPPMTSICSPAAIIPSKRRTISRPAPSMIWASRFTASA